VKVVFDANVVISASAWKGEAYLSLVKVARRQVQPLACEQILEEIRDTARRLEKQKVFPIPPWPVILWYGAQAKLIEPVKLPKPVCRDPKDEIYLGCALAAKAWLVTYDQDLLSLGKPFGIPIMKPGLLLKRLSEAAGGG
jgi:putative PIN family toxin of toxin-antitoxin system